MDGESQDVSWEALSADILSGMRDWRVQHPKATLREIEAALDERFYRLRTRLLQDLALQSSAAHCKETAAPDPPLCPACGTPLTLRGKHRRHLKTSGGHNLTLQRSYGLCPTCKKDLFPPGR
jgi:hypothetical protein